MRAEFASARAKFLATATPFELKLDGWLARAEVIAAFILMPLIGKVGGKHLTLSAAEEIRDAVRVFAASGKPTVAWTDTFGESSNGTVAYFLASGFGEVWLQPTGELNLLGIAAEVQFLRGVLDKLGVDPQLDRRFEYKNAADRIIQREFTPAHREASDRLTESAWEQVVEAITTSRGLTQDELHAAVDRSPLFSDEAEKSRLIDRLGYRDEVYSDVRRRFGGDVRLLFADKWAPDRKPITRIVQQTKQKSAPGIALVDGAGGIVTGRSRRSPLQFKAAIGWRSKDRSSVQSCSPLPPYRNFQKSLNGVRVLPRIPPGSRPPSFACTMPVNSTVVPWGKPARRST